MSISDPSEAIRRAEEYCRRARLVIGPQLGFGVHGIVFAVECQNGSERSAIKIHWNEWFYQTERNAYQRLAERNVSEVLDCAVPEMLGSNDELWVIEMTVVTPPYLLDFAGVKLDEPPDFSEEVMADWEMEKQDQFGLDWPKVLTIVGRLQSYGIYFMDVSPSNVRLHE